LNGETFFRRVVLAFLDIAFCMGGE
jgi:hypothetical protein